MATSKCCVEWHKNVQQVFCDKKEWIDPGKVFVFDQFCPECGTKINEADVIAYRED